MSAFHLKIRDKIAILEFDQPDSKVNVLNSDSMEEFADTINILTNKPKSEVQALLMTSKKEGVFIAGADIQEIEHIRSVEEAKEKAEKGKEILNSLQNFDRITIAVINGACLGGGLELALACQYRVASFGYRVKIGLPEVNFGILPGLGGTQRLPRLIGLTRALTMILSGKIISGREALRVGLIDRLFPEARLMEESLDFVYGLLEGKEKVNRRRKKRVSQIFLENTPFGRAILYSQAKKNVLRKTKGFYPAPLKALEVIKNTYGKNGPKGFLLESESFSELAVTDVSKNLIKVFALNEEFKKFPWVRDPIQPVEIHKCAVVGAGVMGGGIAQLLSYYDIPTRIKDIHYDALKKALHTARGIYDSALKKRRLKKNQVDIKLGFISPTITYKGFENADLIIETVVEELAVKQKVFEELSQIVPRQAIIASNTSSLPITQIAEATHSEDRVVGLHFFNPVHRMPLVEIIKSSKTSDQTLATVIAFARRLGKVVIVVKDGVGFLINRILLPYINEAAFLLEEGMRIERVDQIARNFGMPVGPLELADEVGIDVGVKVAKRLEDAYGERMRVASILEKVQQKGLLGKKTQQGFYLHKRKRKIPNPDIYQMMNSSIQKKISDEVALKRMIYTMINEAARCLEEKVVDRPRTIDIGMILGTGFPPFRAGLLRYADSVGMEAIVRDLQHFEKMWGRERFKPCDCLIEKAEKKQSFYC
ncbi:enoyl-CoA hydratase/isomerase family protein [candidate division TA06 bacterium]|nr:enoyl-CoA hydratase/isomerase family protein [candidate division TA06 bacterium]